MQILLNGKVRELPEGISLLEMIQTVGIKPERVVAEVNRVLLNRDAWESYRLKAQDAVELISFVGGG